jgi:MFS family permease
VAATLYEPAFAAIVQWFDAHRDRALLSVTLIAGLASTIFMPIEAWLLERLGWRPALMTLAVVLAVVTIPIHALLLRRGMAAHATATTGERAPTSMTLAEAARTLVFWVLFIAFFVGNFATASITTHLIPYLVEHGYSASVAAAVIGWTGAMQLPGRMLFVPISARLGARTMVGAVFFAQALGLGQLPFLVRLGTLIPFIVLQGAANGMATLARASSLAEIFGSRNYGAIGGAIALGANGARAVGPVGASLLLVGLGSYVSVFWALSASLVLAGVLVLFVGWGTKTQE